MAEEFLTLMADLDEDTQSCMSGWYDKLKEAGFSGVQTPGLPFHISMATFPLDKEEEAISVMQNAARKFSPVSVHISHIGIFAGGKVLFGAPERDEALNVLHDACRSDSPQPYPWTPHVTVMIDKPQVICAALPVLLQSFTPIVGKITRLHLCAFWPTREIMTVELKGEPNGT